MDAQKSRYKVVDFTKKDIGEALKILHPLVPNQPVFKDLQFALKKGFFRGVKKNKKIIALAAGHNGENGVSLSYYYIDPFYRGKPMSLYFIAHIVKMAKDKRIFIHAENISGFERYIHKVDENEYVFIGFADRLEKMQRLLKKWEV